MRIIPYCTVSGNTVHQFSYGQDESYPACVSLKLALTAKIAELCHQGITDFFTNCEHGVPMWAAEAIVAMRNTEGMPKARVHIVMPYEEQALTWSDNVRERFYNLHAEADSVEILNSRYNDDCYWDTDRFMADHSVMILFDEVEPDCGNEELLDYAKSKGKKIAVVESLVTL